MDAHHRRLFLKVWTRTIHIYISMFGLLAVIFFSVTGIMLNHEEWFGFSTPRAVTREGVLSEAAVPEPDKLAIVEKLRRDFGATGALDSFEIEGDQVRVEFKAPGRRTEARIQRADGRAEITLETHGFSGRLVELHRGTDAGAAWRFILDAMSVVMLAIALTGVILWCLVPKWRPFGIASLGLCAVLCAAVYFALVP
jgi:hypothetical protein